MFDASQVLFNPSAGGTVTVPLPLWSGQMSIDVHETEVMLGRDAWDEKPITLCLETIELAAPCKEELVTCLVRAEGVVPEDAERDGDGAVRVEWLDPVQVTEGEAHWVVTDDLQVHVLYGHGEQFLLRVPSLHMDSAPWWTPFDREYIEHQGLTTDDAWRLVRALQSASAWLTHISARQGQAVADLAQQACEVLRGSRRMFHRGRELEVWTEQARVSGNEFVLLKDGIETHGSRQGTDGVVLDLAQPTMSATIAEALTDALGSYGHPFELPMPMKVELVEPKRIYEDSAWWEITEHLWLVQRGITTVEFCSPRGGPPERFVKLEDPQVFLLIRSLMSARTWMAETVREVEALVAARRRRVMAGQA